MPAALVPFTLSCSTPGRLRWVTTSMARFDPSVDWPTDLSCNFQWNTKLRSWDGECAGAGGWRGVGVVWFFYGGKCIPCE